MVITLRRTASASAALGLAALFALCAPAAAQFGGPAAVTVAPVEMRDVSDSLPVLGTLVAPVESAVAARTPGVVDAVLVRVGDRVEAGAPIARIDPAPFEIDRDAAQAALDRAVAAMTAAEARRALAAQALERAENLRGSTAFSRGQVEDLAQSLAEADADIAQARADMASSEAALARVVYDLDNTVIRAPFGGVVVGRAAQPGQYIQIGAETVRLLDVAALEVQADVPAAIIAALRPGVVVRAMMQDGAETVATVRAVVPSEAASTRTRPVRFSIELDASDARVAAGASVTLRIPVDAPRAALSAPKDALVQGPGGWMVFVVDDGAASPRPVAIGQEVGDSVEILSGVGPGDLVVIRGNERLRPGQPVAPFFADGTPAAPPSGDAAAGDDDDDA